MAEETFNPFEGVKSPKVMVGMPAYNEEKSVGRIVSYAKKYAPFVVVVNDCSTDKTVEKAEAAGGFVVSHTINTGYGGAELTIFETARKYNPDVLVVLDSDGQHNPEDIPRFVEKIQEGYDVVIGSRYLDEESTKLIPAYRKLGMKALNKSVSISSKTLETTDALCGYRAFSRKAYSKVRQIDNSMSGSAELLVQLSEQGMKFVDIPVDVRYDMEDTSTQGPVSLGMDILTGILQTISMKRPRLFFGVPGFISLIVGIILLYITLDTFAATASINPIVALLAIIFFIGGVAFCAISVLLFAISGAIGKEK